MSEAEIAHQVVVGATLLAELQQMELGPDAQAVIYLRFVGPLEATDLSDIEIRCRAKAVELGLLVRSMHMDATTGRKADLVRPGLQEAFEALQPGDALITPSLDRISRALNAAVPGLTFLREKGVRLVLLR